MYKPTMEVLEARDCLSVTMPVFDAGPPPSVMPTGSPAGFVGWQDRNDMNLSHMAHLFASSNRLEIVRVDQQYGGGMSLHWTFTAYDAQTIALQPGITGASLAADPRTGEIIVGYLADSKVWSVHSWGGVTWDAPVVVVDLATVVPSEEAPPPSLVPRGAPVGFAAMGPEILNNGIRVTWVPSDAPVSTLANPMPGPGPGRFEFSVVYVQADQAKALVVLPDGVYAQTIDELFSNVDLWQSPAWAL